MTKFLCYPREVAESLLAECLHSPEVVLAALRDLRPEVFHDVEQRALWRAIVAVFEANNAVDPVLVGDHLARVGALDSVGGIDALTALAERVPYAAHFEGHARILTDYHNRWTLHNALVSRAGVALDPTVSWEDVQEFAHLPDSLTNGGNRPGQVPEPLNAVDLLQRFPTNRPALIEGVLRRGEVGTVVCASKSGKSWLVLQLALAVASGGEWLGKQCKRGRVLCIDLELHGEVLSFRLRSLHAALGLPEEVLRQVDTLALRGTGHTVENLARWASHWSRYDLVILDPLYRALGDADENSNGDMSQVFNHIDAAALASGASWLVVHHASKGGQSQKSVTDTGSGAGSIARASDEHLVLRPHRVPGVSVVEGRPRSFPPLEPFCAVFKWPLWQVASEDLDPTDLAGLAPTRGTVAAAAKQDAADDAEAVLKFLEGQEAFVNLSRIVAGVTLAGRHIHDKRAKAALERLTLEGRAVSHPIRAGANGRPVPGFATPDKPIPPDKQTTPDKQKQTDVGLFPVVSGCSGGEQDDHDEQTERAPIGGASVCLSVGSSGEDCSDDVQCKKRRRPSTKGKTRHKRHRKPKAAPVEEVDPVENVSSSTTDAGDSVGFVVVTGGRRFEV